MKLRVLLALFFSFSMGFAQSQMYNSQQITTLKQLAEELRLERQASKSEAIDKANTLGFELFQKGEAGQVSEIQGLTPNGQLIYFQTDNLDAARTVSTDKVWPGGSLGTSLTGGSVKFGEWDGGAVRLSHKELVGRVTQVDASTNVIDHATHVAGTLIGGGVNPLAKGMAYTANLDAYDWNFDDAEMAAAAGNGMLISNHSYGTITGWRYNSGQSRWEWWGDTTISTTEDYRFGFYDFSARAWDLIALNAPYYLIVKSAGNDRGDFFNGSHYSISSNSFTSTARDPDGGANGYDCISTNGTAKNILTVAAVNAIPSGYSAPSNVVMSSFSGWGPTDDGRIKPDISANGVGVFSSLATHDSAYASYNGTSMAAPNTTGSLVLIQQHYNNLNSSYMLAATLKGLIIHTADEAGSAEGPDYQFGWGLLNTASAVNHITNPNSRDEIHENTLNNNQTFDLVVTSDGLSPLVATICWTDLAGTPPTPSLNPTNKMLVNDLDLRIIQNSNSTVNFPYKLNPASPASAATKADNDLDNVEKVYIAAPTAGTYTVRVTHKGTLSAAQNYSLLVSGGITSPSPISCNQLIGSFPYNQDFETFTNCSTSPASACVLPLASGWENSTSDSIDWTVHNGNTPTASTGPAVDFKPGTAAGKYLYLESTGAGNPSKEGVLLSPCFDLDLISSPEFSFAYHMSGSDMGTISVDVNSGISWTNVFFVSGDQGSGWQKTAIDLSAYVGDTVQIRIRGNTGSGELSDIAIDDISVKSNPLSCNLTISTFPYIQDFETFTNCSTVPTASCLLPMSSGYENATSDDIDWTTHNGATLSGSTGPTSDFNPGNASGKYLYTEASATGGFPNKEAILNGPCYDLSTLSNSELSFAYHMYGLDMGFLYVDVDTGNGWSNEWFVSGNQGDQWNIAQIDMSAYDGKTIQVRFRGVTGTGFRSDIALDNIRMGGPTPRVYCLSGASTTVDTYISDVNFESISNSSTSFCTGYTDYTALVANVQLDSTYLLNITTGDCDGGAAYLHGISVYIDWNNDGSFLGAGEQVMNNGLDTGKIHSVSLTVPSTAVLDSVRMRIVCSENLPIEPCGVFSYGETEDYTIRISPGASPAPVNDDCSNAIALNCGPAIGGTTLNAQPDALATTCGTTISAPGVWYRVKGNGETITVSLCGSGTTYNSKLNVYSGNCLGLNCIAGNDDFCGNSSQLSWNSTNGLDYFILVQGATGETGDFDIEMQTSPSSAVTAGSSLNFCDGGSVNLQADTLLSYQWMLNGSNISGANQQNFNATSSGNYSVITTDLNNCSDTTNPAVVVTEYPLPTVSITPSSATTFCQGSSVNLTATGGVAYQWYRDGIIIPAANGSSYLAAVSGNYNAVATDGNLCSDSAASAVVVTVNALPVVTVSASGPTTFCDGDSVQLTSTSGSSYQWYRNSQLLPSATSAVYFAKTSGVYNVVMTNSNNCADSANGPQSLTANPLPTVSILASGSTTFCEEDSVVLSTTAAGTYQWYRNGNSIPGATAFNFAAKNQGDYNVLVTNSFSCSDSALNSNQVTVNPLPVVNIVPGGPLTFCQGNSVNFSTTNAGTYQWYRSGQSIGSATSANYTASTSGNYNLEVTDANNCSDTAATGQLVLVNPLPLVTITNLGNAQFCAGDSTVLEANGGLSYQWYKASIALSADTVQQLIVRNAGTYNVIGTDLNGCSDSSANHQLINVFDLPVVSFDSLSPICNTITSYVLTEGSPAGGIYSGNGVTSDSIFNPSAAGTGLHSLIYTYTDPVTLCENSSTSLIQVVNCVGIKELSQRFKTRVYPNPTQGMLHISLEKPDVLTEIQLIDVNGKRIKLYNQNSAESNVHFQLDLGEISSGFYFMELHFENGVDYHKVIIER